jgi:hypothetical protein
LLDFALAIKATCVSELFKECNCRERLERECGMEETERTVERKGQKKRLNEGCFDFVVQRALRGCEWRRGLIGTSASTEILVGLLGGSSILHRKSGQARK